MNEPFQLVTNCSFQGKDYLVQMCVLNSKKLELTVTDKLIGDDWHCEYDASYIEALTHKTGNFKQFDVFVMMLKSGLLKTSDCITLELLTVEDLEELRCRKIISSHSSSRSNPPAQSNRRFLILNYTVEFDRIHYPLPLDYCGPPDPSILQSCIRKLEAENERLKQKNNLLGKNDMAETKKLKEKIKKLTEDNSFLKTEIIRLNKMLSNKCTPLKFNQTLSKSLKKLEEQVLHEKNNNQQLILRLRAQNRQFLLQIEDLKKTEKFLKMKLKDTLRYNSQKSCRRSIQNYFTPDNSLDRKGGFCSEKQDIKLMCRPSPNRKVSSLTKAKESKNFRKFKNRYISSSTSESEECFSQLIRSTERKQMETKEESVSKKRGLLSRKSSNERSRHSSTDSKRVSKTQTSRFSTEPNHCSSKEDNIKPQVCSRESSLSSRGSRGSSRHSKISHLSNRGSGDHRIATKDQTPRSIINDREDLKFSMSDLETRIHALQKLLSEGLNF